MINKNKFNKLMIERLSREKMSIGNDGQSEIFKDYIREEDNELMIIYCKPISAQHVLNRML